MLESKEDMVKMIIRVPAEFREQIRNIAKESRRSMNSEVIYRLETSFGTIEQCTQNKTGSNNK